MLKVLYISSLVSDALFNELYNKKLTTEFVGQKYHGLFAKGLAANLNDGDVTALSQPPISKFSMNLKDKEEGVVFRYVPIIPIPIIKQLIYYIFTLFYTLYWCLKNIRHEKVIISSIMRIYQYPSIWLGSLLFDCKRLTVACDVPWMTTIQVATSKLSYKQRFTIWLSKHMKSIFDGYVFMTETMTNVLNTEKKPYIIVEGFCDQNMSDVSNLLENKNKKKVIIYAGGLNSKYGISNLITAIKIIKRDDIELWLYGNGDMTEELKSETDPRIRYFGPRSNKEVVEAEVKASILINPRPTSDEYTHYSFPSKTLEYMASGTYTMTTRLAGIPAEYFNYCGVISDYSSEGIAKALSEVLKLSKSELHEKGLMAKDFVLNNKNNHIQTKRVIDFIYGL